MDLSPHIASLREDLLAAAAVGGDDIRQAATVLGAAIEPAARLAIMSALSELAAEVTDALGDTTVEIRLDGRDVRVTVDRGRAADEDEDDTDAVEADGAGWRGPGPRFSWEQGSDNLRRVVQEASGELSRTTVRLWNDLKAQAERAAADQGVSLNTYISRAVHDSVRGAVPTGRKGDQPGDRRDRRGRGGRTVTGYFQA
ncbi:toxin-antitoxin system HicB family antitoxin [Nakamurella endophytica]|uniref:Toxin-antitoxin system HicB family antitoxin n=1 Tax=Nakamurella endophytica TaxID=1748367 RepID=A0A917WDT9_9ACTN|nr:toxin-antitoxin system HicB family antitoxin [Nakamurella endophytica]GGL95291.1 hypothetical protein GCM10011594_13680 [Nakamurella endophytica]